MIIASACAFLGLTSCLLGINLILLTRRIDKLENDIQQISENFKKS